MFPLVTKKLTFETVDKLPKKGGIVFTATLSTVIPKSRRGRKLDEERSVLIIEDKDNKKDKPGK